MRVQDARDLFGHLFLLFDVMCDEQNGVAQAIACGTGHTAGLRRILIMDSEPLAAQILAIEVPHVGCAINGEPLSSASATVTPAAVENYFNIYVTAFVEVPRGCCLTVAAENTSTQTVLFANANFVVERVS